MDGSRPLDPVDPNIPSRHLQSKIQTSEKPLPAIPGATEQVKTMSTSIMSPINAEDSGAPNGRPLLAAQPSYQRPCKRIAFGNRILKIALPLENQSGMKTNRESYLKAEDVQRRLTEWTNQGYDIRAFILAPLSDSHGQLEAQGQSRPIHPDPEDEKREHSQRKYCVSIPDRREWEAYVHLLKEEKLRALGVSIGDEEPGNARSPVPSLMQRGASSQGSPMLLSPPLASSSSGSVPPSGTFPGLPNPHGHLAKQPVSHFSRFSVVSPFGDHNLSHQFPPSQSPAPGPWSPQHYFSPQPGSRVSSPAVNGHVSHLGKSFSPAPAAAAVQQLPQSVIPPEHSDLLTMMRQQQAQVQAQQITQQHQQQHDVLLPRSQWPIPRGKDQDPDSRKTNHTEEPQILTPVPRGHRQNLSESLQREVEEAEAMLEASVPNSEHTAESTSEAQKERKRSHDDSTQAKSEPLSNTVVQKPTSSQAPAHENKGDVPRKVSVSHESKVSLSKLNVNAPEFKLEQKKFNAPSTSLLPTSQPQAQSLESVGSSHAASIIQGKKTSTGSTTHSKLNVAAPIFTPNSTQSAPKPLIPSRVFSFSSTGPSFNPDAPAFNPMASTAQLNQVPIKSHEPVKKIFGEVKLPDVIKPTKKSQALPIVKPSKIAAEQNKDADAQDDEFGRIMRSDSRQKRARRYEDDGDQVPLFATPGQTPWLNNTIDERAAYFGHEHSSSSDSGPVKTLEAAADLLGDLVNNLEPSEASSATHGDEDLHGTKASSDFTTSSDSEKSEGQDLTIRAPRAHDQKTGKTSPIHHNTRTVGKAELISSDNDIQSEHVLDRRSAKSKSYSPASSGSKDLHFHQRQDYGQIDTKDTTMSSKPLRQDILDGVRYVDASYHEIDEVMKHMNEDLEIDSERLPRAIRSAMASPINHLGDPPTKDSYLAEPARRSRGPSPSPNRLKEPFQYLPPTDSESAGTAAREFVARNARFSPSYRPSKLDPYVNRLNSPGSTPPSDWNDALSSADEAKFHLRTGFFDHRVNDTVGQIVQQRLGPIEKSLLGIQESLARLDGRSASRRPRSSGTIEVEKSDADDEDDELETGDRASSRLKSPPRDRKLDQLKLSISEIAAAQQTLPSTDQMAELLNTMKEMKELGQQAPREAADNGDLKTIVEEAIARQMRGRSAPVTSSSQAAAAEKSALQIAGLESMLKVATARAEEELNARRATEDALADSQRLLRAAMQEAAEQRESAEATERSLQDYHAEHHELLSRMATLEGSQDRFQNMGSDLMQKNAALEETLNEYRISSDEWRSEVEDLKYENKDLKKQADSLRAENGELIQNRSMLRNRFDQLQESMHSSARDLAADQSRWRSTEEAHKNKLEMLSARLEAEARTRERLELEIERLESQEKESMKARMQVDQTLKANAHLDRLVGQIRSESHDHLKEASQLERELQREKEDRTAEVRRIRTEFEVESEAANSHFAITQNNLQSAISNLERQLGDAATRLEAVQSHHSHMLEEAAASKTSALQEAGEAGKATLQDQAHLHERTMAEVKDHHRRAIEHALEDKQRSETHFGHRLNLADEKITHYQDRISHLEERLEIAKQAANAAVQAAQAKKSSIDASKTASTGTSGTESSTRAPEKISPQALRESILVLQEQLQAREVRLEELESELSQVDTTAPAKLKDAQVENAWLRELLSVRIDDLEDIIRTLSQGRYDRDAVKDAAIRLKANLQMELQEKERAMASNSQTSSNLMGISNLAASPKSLPFAAAAAWGNWRKGRDSSLLSSLGGVSIGSVQQTPSKSSAPQSLFAGLMTPPSTDLRSSPTLQANSPSRTTSLSTAKTRQGAAGSSASYPRQMPGDTRRRVSQQSNARKTSGGPLTPPLNLMRRDSYDMDAREGPGFDDAIKDEDPGQGADEFNNTQYEVGPDEAEPFGPKIGTFAT